MKKYIKLVLIIAIVLIGLQVVTQKVLASYDFLFSFREVDLAGLGISSFSFPGLDIPKIVTIDNTANTITVNVPYGTDITKLAPEIITDYSRAVVTPTGPRNFTNPVTYRVDSGGNIKTYEVSVIVQPRPLSQGNSLLSFTLPPEVLATSTVINEAAKTVDVTLRYGTDYSKLTPVITVSPDATYRHYAQVVRTYYGYPTFYFVNVTAEDGTVSKYSLNVTANQFQHVNLNTTANWNDGKLMCSKIGGTLISAYTNINEKTNAGDYSYWSAGPYRENNTCKGQTLLKECSQVVNYDGAVANAFLKGGGLGYLPVTQSLNIICDVPNSLVNATCGSNADSFSSTTFVSTGTFCSAGVPNPTNPISPTVGKPTSWTCNGINGGTNATCSSTQFKPNYTYYYTQGVGNTYGLDWPAANDLCHSMGGTLPPGGVDPKSLNELSKEIPGSTVIVNPGDYLKRYYYKSYWTDLAYYNKTVTSGPNKYVVPVARAMTWSATGNFSFVDAESGHPQTYSGRFPVLCLIPTTPVNGACGPNTSVSTTSTSFTSAFCASGVTTPSVPAFPALGSATTWSCNGIKGGTNATCVANRGAISTTTPPTSTSTITYILTVNATSTGGTVTKTPDKAVYHAGESVTVTATPRSGYIFKNWLGSITGTVNPQTIIMNANKNAGAVYSIQTN
jgi:hypothetical protein